MKKHSITSCFQNRSLILTEGAIGQRIERDFGFSPDKDIMYAALIYETESRNALEKIYRQYLQTAQDYELPMLLMTNTRRANKERVMRSNYKHKNIMADYAQFLREIASNYQCETFIGGMMGCKGDAYSGNDSLSIDNAIAFHTWQADMVGDSDIDFMFAGIMPAMDEAIGMAKVMEKTGLPYIISLMINKDGVILDGHSIHETIKAVDEAVNQKPLCFMTNCVHPAILREALSKPFNNTPLVRERFWGIQANAACFSPIELDASTKLITTNAEDLAYQFELLCSDFPMKILGGCCGTDNTHIEEIARRFG